MDLVTWKDEMSVGVKRVDDQHRRMIAMINGLHAAMLEKRGKEVLGHLFEELAEYTVTHFGTEEELMQAYRYPEGDFAYHKLEHEKLVQQVIMLREKARAGELAVSVEVMHFLRDWLQNHILETDRKMKPFFAEKGLL